MALQIIYQFIFPGQLYVLWFWSSWWSKDIKINLFWQSVKISFDMKWNVCLFQSKKCIVVKPCNEIKCYFMIKVLWALLQKHSWNLLQTHFFLLNYFEDVTWWIKYELACHFIHTLFRKKKKKKTKKLYFGWERNQTNHLYLGHVGSVSKDVLSCKTYTIPSSLRLLQNKPLIYLRCKLFGA